MDLNTHHYFKFIIIIKCNYDRNNDAIKKGVFASFLNEWTTYVPFNNWIILALFLIILFGIGNAFASLNGLLKKERKLYNLTMIMGILLVLSTVIQVIVIKEWFLATVEFLFIGLIQILLGLFGINAYKKGINEK